MKKKEKTVCQIIRFRGNIDTFLVSIEKFARFSYQYEAKYVLIHCAGIQEVGERSQNLVGKAHHFGIPTKTV